MESKNQHPYTAELDGEQLEGFIGGFEVGETLRLKSGRTACAVCGIKNIQTFVYQGKGTTRLAHVILPCGHETFIPERAIEPL